MSAKSTRMEQRIKAAPSSPFFHSSRILHKQTSSDTISLASSFDSGSIIGSFIDSYQTTTRQFDSENPLSHDSQTPRSLEEEDEEDIDSIPDSSTISLSYQMPSTTTTPLSFNKIQRSHTADPDLNNVFFNNWDTPEPLHVNTEPKRHHYLTRSQSALTYPPKSKLVNRRSFYGTSYSASNNPFVSSPLRTEYDPREPEALASEAPEYGTHRRSQFMLSAPSLSPIEEGSLHDKNDDSFPNYKPVHSDNVSLNSNLSAQSSLFINRRVNSLRLRTSPSTSTIGSTISFPPKTPTNTDFPSGSQSPPSPVNSGTPTVRRVHRSFTALSVIPASPRASQTVSLHEPSEDELTYATLPPCSYSGPGPSIVLPTKPPSVLTKTPSLLTKSESMQTELTYLTAPDSLRSTSRASDGVHTSRFSDLLDRMSNDGRTIFSPRSPMSPSTIKFPAVNVPKQCTAAWGWVKSAHMPDVHLPKVHMPNVHMPHVNVHIINIHLPKAPRATKRESGNSIFKRDWWDLNMLPAKALFWMGFLGPWCWLIGGWMLNKGGTTEVVQHGDSFLPRWNDESTESFLKVKFRQSWYKKGYSAHTLAPFTPGASSQSLLDHRTPLRPLHVLQNQRTSPAELNTWVLRCRIAAILSGILILAAIVVVLVVLFVHV